MYIPFSFAGASSGSIVLNGLQIWNSYGGYDASAGTWQDLSGNGNSGSVIGTLTDVGGAYSFNGINNSVFYGQSIPDTLTTNLTISFMGSGFPLDGVNRWAWYAYDNIGVPAGFWQYFRNTATPDDLEFRCTRGGGNVTFNVPYNYNPPETTMYTITVSGAQVVYYKNSQILATINNPSGDPYYVGPGFPSNPLSFGSGSGLNTFSGSISNLLLYDRTLTSNEVTNNWNYLIGTI